MIDYKVFDKEGYDLAGHCRECRMEAWDGNWDCLDRLIYIVDRYDPPKEQLLYILKEFFNLYLTR